MTLLHPLWLAAYPPLLFLWWIRPRGGPARRVAALFLWEGAAAGGGRRRLTIRPTGGRVPLLLLLLVLALAAPQGETAGPDAAATPPSFGVVCEGALPAPLRAYLAELGAPCVAAAPWTVEVHPGTASGRVEWAVDDPLFDGLPADPVAATELRPLEVGEWDRVLATTAAGPVVSLHPTATGGRLRIGADLATPGLRDAPPLPHLLAAWIEEIRDAPPLPPPERTVPRWRWPVGAALLLLWLPWPRQPRWGAAATLPLVAALLFPGGGVRAVVLDLSPSCTGADLALAAAAAMEGSRRVVVVAAAAEAEVWVGEASRPGVAIATVRRLLAAPRPASRATPLAAAVARGLALAPEGVVVSDGRAAAFAAPAGSRLHCRLLPSAALSLHLPSRLPEGAAAVAVAALTGVTGAARLLWRIDGTVAGEGVIEPPGVSRLPLLLSSGSHRIEAQVAGLPPAAGRVEVEGRPRLAVVGELALATVAGAEQVMASLDLGRLLAAPPGGLVVASGAKLDDAGRQAIVRAVAAGMGLLWVGEPPLAGDPLAPLLPLQPGAEGGRPPVAVVVVLDRSGSMAEAGEGAGSSLDLGVAATLAVRRALGPADRWGLIAFDRDLHLLDPLGAPPVEAELRHRLALLTGAGGTDPWRAVAAAEALLGATPGEGEIVLITDGRVGPPPVAPGGGVRITAIQVGDRPPEPALARLCAATGGHWLHAATAAELPTVLTFAPPAPLSARGPTTAAVAAEAPFPLRGGAAVTRGWPTHPNATARVVLRAGGDPLLALDRYGLGRTAQWVGPAGELAAAPEIVRPLLAWLAPHAGGLEAGIAGDDLWVGIAGAGGSAPVCTVRPAASPSRPLPLHRVVGGFRGATSLATGGVWEIEVEGGGGASPRRIVEMGDPEWAIPPAAGKARLARLARTTGGKLLTANAPPPPPPPAPAPAPLPLLLAACCLLLSPRPGRGDAI